MLDDQFLKPSLSKSMGQRGYSLVEVMVTIAIMIGLSLIVAEVSRLYSRISRQTDLIASRDELATNLRKSLLDQRTIISSLKAKDAAGVRLNPELFNCVCGVGTCKSMVQPFAVLTVVDSGQSLLSPAVFTDRAFPCDPSLTRCDLDVSTTFFAECKPDFDNGSQNPAPVCSGQPAEFLAINYKIQNIQKQSQDQGQEPLRPLSGWAFVQIDQMSLTPDDCL